jgi:N-acetylmuramoyl-L-alanine amidase
MRRADQVHIGRGPWRADGGAVGPDGTYESALNLSICHKLDAILGLYGYSQVLTRNSEEIDYPGGADTIRKKKIYDQNRRLELINSVETACSSALHLNKFPSAQPRGAQALSNGTERAKETGGVHAGPFHRDAP